MSYQILQVHHLDIRSVLVPKVCDQVQKKLGQGSRASESSWRARSSNRKKCRRVLFFVNLIFRLWLIITMIFRVWFIITLIFRVSSGDSGSCGAGRNLPAMAHEGGRLRGGPIKARQPAAQRAWRRAGLSDRRRPLTRLTHTRPAKTIAHRLLSGSGPRCGSIRQWGVRSPVKEA